MQPNVENLDRGVTARLNEALVARGSAVAFRSKRYGLWQPISGLEVLARSQSIARGLISTGLASNDVGAIIGDNCAEWVLADLGIMAAGGVSAGLDASSSRDELVRLLNLLGVKVLFVAGDDQLHKAVAARSQCPVLRRIVVMHQQWDDGTGTDAVVPLAQLELLAPGAATLGAPDSGATAAILMTSGITAPPRGARFKHGPLGNQARRAAAALGLRHADERLSLMPMHHAFERVVGIYAALLAGSIVNFPENRETAFSDLVELQPTVVQAAPQTWARLKSGIELAVSEATPFQQWLCRKSLKASPSGEPNALASALVLPRIRRRLGLARARLCISGGAVLRPDVAAWFAALNRPLTDVYGHAETAGVVSFMRYRGEHRTLEGVELEAGSGEIRVRSDALFSAYADKGMTAPDEEWWSSGDAAPSGDVPFTHPRGRISDLIIREGSVRLAQFETEAALVRSPYISDAFLSRDPNDRVVAAILINPEMVVKYAQDNSIPFTHFLSLCRAAGIRSLIGRVVAQVNEDADVQIDDFIFIERALGPSDAEVGPALTLRRRLLRPINAIPEQSQLSERA